MKHIIALIFISLALTGCVALQWLAPVSEPVAVDAERIENGRQIYLDNYCGVCHQLTIANTRGTFGPPHNEAGTNAAKRIQSPDYTGNAQTPAEYIRESLLDPHVFYTPGYEITSHHMPAYTHLSDEDIEALVYMLVNQR